jgi:hypothetical protein
MMLTAAALAPRVYKNGPLIAAPSLRHVGEQIDDAGGQASGRG